MAVTWGLDPKAKAITVYYEGDSTIYEGMPLCYNYNTTDNWIGVSAADLDVESDTTAEGYQNEGKFIRVEDPDSENLQWFAGVVVGCGKSGKTGPCALDIYIPNGATVPVRAGISCYVGVTLLAIQDSSQSFEQPIYGSAFVTCAIADETVDRTTDGLVLAKLLGVNHFSNGTYDIPLRTGDGITTGQVRVFERDISFRGLGSEIQATVLRTRLKGATAYCDNGGALFTEVYVEGADDAPAGNIWTTQSNLIFDPGCTLGDISAGAMKCRVTEIVGSGCTKTSAQIAPLQCFTWMDDAHACTYLSQIMFTSMGTDKPDGLFNAQTADAIGYTADTTGTNQSGAIAIRIAGVDHYLHTFDNVAGAT